MADPLPDRQAAVAALAEAVWGITPLITADWESPDWGVAMLDYLDAAPVASAALVAWLARSHPRRESAARRAGRLDA